MFNNVLVQYEQLISQTLTPNRLDVLEWPNRIWAMSLDLKFLKDFLKLFVFMCLAKHFAKIQIS